MQQPWAATTRETSEVGCLHASTDTAAIVEGLSVATTEGIEVLQDVSLTIGRGEVLGLVGETGCGKTTLGLALLGFTRVGLEFAGGRVTVQGRDILDLSAHELRTLRGSLVSYVPQDALSSLNPGLRLGQQFDEMLAVHGMDDQHERRERIADVLHQIDLPGDKEFLRRYPHQVSGGQQQRVAIAVAFLCRPAVVVMDEPTTGLDVATQLRVLAAVDSLRRRDQSAVLMVSHDLSMLSKFADRLTVMYAGRIVEAASAGELLGDPRHPYTFGLLEAIPDTTGEHALVGIPGKSPTLHDRTCGCPFAPRCNYMAPACTEAVPVLEPLGRGSATGSGASPGACRLARCFRVNEITLTVDRHVAAGWPARAEDVGTSALAAQDLVAWHGQREVLDRVSVTVPAGSCVALVGESGSGKTTLARCLVGLHYHYAGEVTVQDKTVAPKARDRSRETRRLLQYVFQNPYSSLNPRKTILATVAQPLRVFSGLSSRAARQQVIEALESVGLGEEYLKRYPHELSGGERQRVALARALVARPAVLICDEVTSSLDVSVQAVIVNLLRQLQSEKHMAMLFITHNLPLVRHIAERVMVLQKGRVVESGLTEEVLSHPSNAYTRSLLEKDPGQPPATESDGDCPES